MEHILEKEKMTYLNYIKKINLDSSNRWIIKRDSKGKIKEVKHLFNPEEYKKNNKHNRKLYTKQELIQILENDKT